MRRVTRNAVVLILVVLVALLALGALPGLLKSGDPYYVTAEPVGDGAGVNATAAVANASAVPGVVNGTALSERRFPYTTEALRNGTSESYWRGPVGIKGAFTHSPFDELSALERQAAAGGSAATADNGSAADGSAATATPAAPGVVASGDSGGVLVTYNGTLYSVGVGQDV